MEDLGGLIVVIVGILIAIANGNAKNKKKKQSAAASAQTVYQPAIPVQPQTAAPVSMASMLPPQPAAPAAPVAPVAPAAPVAPIAPAQPLVHEHLEPDCDTHDQAGSLGVTSMEGKDPCHEEQLTHSRPVDTAEAVQPGLTLEWTGDAMVKAFVMQEVLTRPCDRKPRRI
ncbi:MAG: hypothetical protein ACI4MG_07545 [Aristaeellaceae bacterium]